MLHTLLERKLEGVGGWLYRGEAFALLESVLSCPNSALLSVIEIGSFKGRSTIALALGVQARGGGTLHAIDPHIDASFDDFIRNIAAAAVADVVEPIRQSSATALGRFAPRSVDVLFVDGSHEYSDVKADIVGYSELLKDQAMIAFNDPSHPGVYRALRELVLRPSPFRRPKLVENTLFFDFDRNAEWTGADGAALRRLRIVLALRSVAIRLRPYTPFAIVRLGHILTRVAVAGGRAP